MEIASITFRRRKSKGKKREQLPVFVSRLHKICCQKGEGEKEEEGEKEKGNGLYGIWRIRPDNDSKKKGKEPSREGGKRGKKIGKKTLMPFH